MTKYVPDISSSRWVILSPQRLGRPGESEKKFGCPFCDGHEAETTEEVLRYGPGEPGTPGWHLRVIKNKYPITDIHEVFVHSPNHDGDIEDMTPNQVQLILQAYKSRYNEHKDKGQVMIFCNHGEHAGASIDHPHSQLVVLPNQINIDALIKEPLQNIVIDNHYFVVYCPDFSQWPYEVWIAPKNDGSVFGEISDEKIEDLADIMQHIIRRLERIYRTNKVSKLPFGYNYYIYPKENWYLRIIPRYIHRAGFELGTGLSVNIVDPHEAAEKLR
jgi:UDPglucose--hexose-1-phosphate uridylyltransferase